MNLKNDKNIGVIIQYIKIKKDKKFATHFWEDDGVEYLEKNNNEFEKEYYYFITKVSKDHL